MTTGPLDFATALEERIQRLQESGLVMSDEEAAAIEAAREQERAEGLRVTAAKVAPARYGSCSWETWNGHRPAVPPDWTFLLIHGPTGAGKTHLATAILCELADGTGCRGVEWWSTPALVDAVEPRSGEERAVMERVIGARLLLLDDLAAERLTDFTRDRISLVLRQRYDHMRRTIITTNKTPEQLGEWDARLASRICSEAVIALKGRDRRLAR